MQDHLSTNSSLTESREHRVTTEILPSDPSSGLFWAQSGCSALLPVCLLPTFTPHPISTSLCQPYFEKHQFQALSRSRPHSGGVKTPSTFLVSSSWSSEAQKMLEALLGGAWCEFLSRQPLALRWQRKGECGSLQVSQRASRAGQEHSQVQKGGWRCQPAKHLRQHQCLRKGIIPDTAWCKEW